MGSQQEGRRWLEWLTSCMSRVKLRSYGCFWYEHTHTHSSPHYVSYNDTHMYIAAPPNPPPPPPHSHCCVSLLSRSFLLLRVSFRKHMASLKLGSRMPIKYDECMKRTAELELCHLAVTREGSGKKRQKRKKKDKEEILVLHAPHPLFNIFLEMCIIAFDWIVQSIVSCKIKHMDYRSCAYMRKKTRIVFFKPTLLSAKCETSLIPVDIIKNRFSMIHINLCITLSFIFHSDRPTAPFI